MMSQPPPVAVHLKSENPLIGRDQLQQLAVALQIQVDRDLGPRWNVRARIQPLEPGSPEPLSGNVIVVRSVADGPSGSLAASHELCEMLVNPSGDRLAAAPSLESGQGIVRYRVQICEPCRGQGYRIGGVLVADFCLPNFYQVGLAARRYSHAGSLTSPLHPRPPAGAVSWRATDGTWWRAAWNHADPSALQVRPENAASRTPAPLAQICE